MTSREAYIAFKMGTPVLCRVQGDFFDSEYTIVAYTEYIPRRQSLKDRLNPNNKYKYEFILEDENGFRITTTASELKAVKEIDETFVYFDIPIPEGV